MNNPQNTLITKDEVESILNYFRLIGDNNTKLKINNLHYYQEAFIHESYYQSITNVLNNSDEKLYLDYKPKESNERMEYLGDHILKAVLGRYLFMRFPKEREGFLTKLKIKIEKCSMLHQFGMLLGFKKYLLLSLQVENQTILDISRGRHNPSFYEDAFEAFIGAIFLDFGIENGYKYCDRFIVSIIENVVDFAELISNNDNFKDSVQRIFHKYFPVKFLPQYWTLSETGPVYRKLFTRVLFIDYTQFQSLSEIIQNKIQKYTIEHCNYYRYLDSEIYDKLIHEMSDKYILGIGVARKIINAEQIAAKMALLNLGFDVNY